jgi:stage V sporulation protein G
MEISEVRVKIVSNKDERLKAFCSMTLDNEFVIRDIKVIEGTVGYFVAMPSRKMSDHCDKCGGKNHLRARYCNNCGASLPENRARKDMKGRMKLHADIAHPINAECRQRIQERIIQAFEVEFEKSKQPGYKPVDMDEPDDDVPDDS